MRGGDSIKGKKAISELLFISVQTGLRTKPFIYNVFLLQVHFCRFHMKGFARGLVLKQMHKVARKWPIISSREKIWRVTTSNFIGYEI